MQKSFRKRASALALAAAMTLTLASAPVSSVNAASKSVQVVTQATYNDGRTVKYTYNKKGLITKSVSKSSYKTNSEYEYEYDYDAETDEEVGPFAKDVDTTITTTYKYNKKNKVASKTAKVVTKTKYLEADKATGLTIKGTSGTITTTNTTVTKYTYNKKGLATQSVATTTTTKAGSLTKTKKTVSPSFSIDGDYSYGESSYTKSDALFLSDGSLLAGYNKYKADGTTYDENTKENAFYYTGAIASAEGTKTTTTTYTNNGNGSYTEAVSTSTTAANYTATPVVQYYGKEYDSETDAYKIIAITKTEEKDSYGDTHTVYKKADGTDFYGQRFAIVSSVTLAAGGSTVSTKSNDKQNIITDKSVTTTKYTYDKKKRVKKAVATTVSNDNNTYTTKSTSNRSGSSSTGSYSFTNSEETNFKGENTTESTSVVTTTYKYDKKGRVSKKVTTNPGVEDSKSTSSDMTVDSKSTHTTTYTDGTSVTDSSSSSYSGYPKTVTTVVANGVETVTTTYNDYTYTYAKTSPSYFWDDDDGWNSEEGTISYTSFKDGGKKSVDTYTKTRTNKSYDPATGNYTTTSTLTRKGSTTNYSFDEKGKSYGYIEDYTDTYAYTDGTTSTPGNTKSTYFVDKDGKSNSDPAALTAAVVATETSGTPYSKVETSTNIATPSKDKTTYKYDKKGNLATAKSNGTNTSVVTAVDDVYGNKIYEFDAAGKLQIKKNAVTHKYTGKDSNENTIKTGTKVITKKLTTSTGTYDRAKSSGKDLSNVLFKLKGKKASKASLAEKQQWIIQNGNLNGQVGL